MLELPPLALYIHYPWCVKKCPYCDFNSHEGDNREGYIELLLEDLDEDLSYAQGRSIGSIFIGGGTPSLMSELDLSKLFEGLRSRLTFENDIEITLEANPGTFEIEKFKAFKGIGINRLSIGVQSFNDQNLKSLGRIHDADEAGKACTEAAKLFDNFNIDLMYGLKGQTLEGCLLDLRQAIELGPTHISFYQLTIEPNTLFAKFPPTLPKEDDIWKMGEAGVKLLEDKGFNRYEVSAFGKTPSKHNINYWEFGDYIGIGAGAHGKITLKNEQKIIRTLKSKSPKDYINQRQKTTEIISNPGFEFMLNALRLKDGFDMDLFDRRTGLSIDSIKNNLDKVALDGLLDIDKNRIIPTTKGYDFLNDLQGVFL
ncbi:Oxygen-independent coproporphyrinogen-III oxidase-like protein YggW [uncultured Gammaproteobacteria bacterium]|uniref:radical SAM family heme chaperone HemW n=1 Tax=Bathymodiolus heckerae thiotrophic gill symbiont TaxID=1052212 RepID=UPI0010BB46BA|nr:radical SAM family heme chaperone HemW [Bathymodiolus heckerae thiotrophic gill symbiont]CAC9582358.1 Oxygen-independent coproporphyrinogen-III oxidase-like protein YggW [uncultured Gammaproteobacteria bacterium]CAC9595853.1 Oxygen-independent coproporphyrinogen-III oxidase-like protein YggW [uncultured Gammaproteobacteria bacterium]CAC9607468.1 Oxygen-independent coproporphyrinogen-III oxidase-like protein YggW [uncultured Gammaproteobacteria bacterium]CAC9956345.1 Oxygen-independent coprop